MKKLMAALGLLVLIDITLASEMRSALRPTAPALDGPRAVYERPQFEPRPAAVATQPAPTAPARGLIGDLASLLNALWPLPVLLAAVPLLKGMMRRAPIATLVVVGILLGVPFLDVLGDLAHQSLDVVAGLIGDMVAQGDALPA